MDANTGIHSNDNEEGETRLALLPAENVDQKSQAEIPPQAEGETRSFRADIRDWIMVLSGVILSGVIMVAIIIVLMRYDGHRQPEWNIISLNSGIAWLSTLSKACVLYSVTQALGQLKWVWFAQRRRPVSDLATFDAASRGVKGSALLLWLLNGRHFAVFGSTTMILALAFEPFIQNMVHYVPRSIDDESQVALLGRTMMYNTVGPLIGGSNHYIDPVLKANIYNALMNQDSTRPWATPQYTCPTGNCTWGAFLSLGVEAQCADITAHLQRNCTDMTPPILFNCTVSLPSGLAAFYSPGGWRRQLSAMGTFDGTDAVQYQTTTFPVVQYILAVGTNTDPTVGVGLAENLTETSPFTATECALMPVVQLFNVTISLGVYQETQIFNYTITDYISDPTNKTQVTWGFGRDAWAATGHFLENLFAGSVEAMSGVFGFVPSEGSQNAATTDAIEAIFYGNFTATGCTADDPLTCAMVNVAAAMTKTIRDSSFTSQDSPPLVGLSQITVSFVEIRWPWVALPVGVWVLGALSCIGAAWKSYRAGTRAWMTSELPLVFADKHWQGKDDSKEEEEGDTAITDGPSPSKDLEAQLHAGGHHTSLGQFENMARQTYTRLEVDKGSFVFSA
ncbi:hypothetical protein BP00DRAFT_425543 [Aspergillus indologenus CBS 114.80]|uniref:Uncharacterized protein n=1 Tax=Aspergillus indologenus CBS 114.80 TaxID=1450541 RepID=A0A2V5I424_9EURO|nr:hypothetical protein BP00DRAFT_425543 [Aspergillus indologenus CBS 114.80]